MKPYKRPESVLVVVHTRHGRVLLLKRADLPAFWQSVTGAMRWDETDPRATAVRELHEETGLVVAPSSLRDLGLVRRFAILPALRHRYAPDVVENLEHAFALELDTDITPVLSPQEHTEFRWLPTEEAIALAWSSTNRDAIRAAVGAG